MGRTLLVRQRRVSVIVVVVVVVGMSRIMNKDEVKRIRRLSTRYDADVAQQYKKGFFVFIFVLFVVAFVDNDPGRQPNELRHC